MALHDRLTYPGITEPTYKQVTDLVLASTRYSREIFNNVTDELVDSIVSGSHAYHACINNILIPETRGLLGSVDYAELSLGAKRNMGTVPAQNMRRGVQKVGHRVCAVDETNPRAMLKSNLDDAEFFSPTATFELLNKYPAGAPLTKAEIDALKKNKLRPCLWYHKDASSKVDAVHFSNGILCTGYVQLLDDALQLFKNYCSTCIGKRFVNDYPGVTWEVYPRRIVYDPSRLIKSCSNPIINEAAQIALECDMVSSKGVKTKGALHLSNPNTYEESRVIDEFSADYVASETMGTDFLLKYLLAGRKDLLLLIFITSCYYFKEDLEAQDK